MASSTPPILRTHGVKYIGSKNKVVPYILNTIQTLVGDNDDAPPTILDVFAGTTRVSQAFRERGWKTVASDLAWASENYTELFLRTTRDELGTLRSLAQKLDRLGDEAAARDADGGVGGEEAGWITRTYCDVAPANGVSGDTVRVWQPHNGIRADRIRDTIQQWAVSGTITAAMEKRLVALLILALDAVDSTVGVQQAYLKQWAKRSANVMNLESRLPNGGWSVWDGPVGEFIGGDALAIAYPPADVAYVDPPYTTHSYATYYHIWDSISRWDKPEVGLKTNRRIDRVARGGCHDASMKSAWNTKSRALGAFRDLVNRLPVKHVVVSYSNEALVPIETVIRDMKILPSVSSCDVYTIDHTRNIMANIGNGADPGNHRNVVEYIVVLHKEPSVTP